MYRKVKIQHGTATVCPFYMGFSNTNKTQTERLLVTTKVEMPLQRHGVSIIMVPESCNTVELRFTEHKLNTKLLKTC